ncbi:M20 family metallopeptidase [Pseudobacillus wudalianchiensis]|uniref:Amidohydrolase n=1 Tax=Pseudobacillus wudalianchiensis TaxID=1743143 RepID=A0A1B9AE15_9BACI|nr:M20 family metallopeptidase [Bacillus wudalianchiensis]OCA82093.1 amidohydrolase [Bacillus wudalianchiensis]
MKLQTLISDLIEQKRDKFIKLSDKIWHCPEINFQEHQSSAYLCQALEAEGFHIEREVAGLQTGFIGSYGSGKPVVAILGEFDALTGLSQKKGLAKHEPVTPGGHGHGCGHNLLGAGAFAAAVAVKNYMKQTGLQGTVRYYGCPAEENGSGKAFMARAGLFDDVDLALSWHPSTIPIIWNVHTLANYAVTFKFNGKSAHAAAAPHLGRSALDAVELMNIGVNYLREHMISEARVHYAITDTGGTSPNVVQPHAEVAYLIRAPKKQQVKDLYERVYNIAKGAALMTGTSMEVEFEGSASNLIPNVTLANVMYKHLTAVGTPYYDQFDQQFAKEIRATLTQEDVHNDLAGLDKETALYLKDKAIADIIPPLGDISSLSGSTDVGDVSWVVPTIQCMTACWALGTPFHTWQAVSQGAMPIAHKGMLQAGKVIACTAIEAMLNPNIIEKAKLEWKDRMEGETYESLIPENITPPRKEMYV